MSWSSALSKLLERRSSRWNAEDTFYRFYHGIFKAYALQTMTDEVVARLRQLSEQELNPLFLEIVEGGTGIQPRRSVMPAPYFPLRRREFHPIHPIPPQMSDAHS